MVGFKATDVPPTATVKFLGAGTAACIADLITFPLDTAKVRLQIQGESQGLVRTAASAQYRGVLGTILTMGRTEGPRILLSETSRAMACSSLLLKRNCTMPTPSGTSRAIHRASGRIG